MDRARDQLFACSCFSQYQNCCVHWGDGLDLFQNPLESGILADDLCEITVQFLFEIALFLLRAVDGFLSLFPFGDIANCAQYPAAFGSLYRSEHDLDREFSAIPPPA